MDIHIPPTVTQRAYERLTEILQHTQQSKSLRVAVNGGGCSGFQYDIRLDDAHEDDLKLSSSNTSVVIDPVSLPFLYGATIDYSDDLIGARFVVHNPNATSGCGCGISFSL